MQVVYQRCCGLDVHKKMVVACLLTLAPDGQRRREVRTFGTMTGDLLLLLDWLKDAGCTHVAFESTGVYWRPIFNLLEGDMMVFLVNAQHIKAVPGRKTDVKDAEWIADLLQHGLLRPSFIPPAPQRELRELTRYRRSLVADRARVINRLQKVLEDTNLKLTSVVTDVTGVSARAILRAYLRGQTDPQELAKLAVGKLRRKQALLVQAMVGTVKDHHRFLLLHQLALLETFDQQITEFDQEIATRIAADDEEPVASPLLAEEQTSVASASIAQVVVEGEKEQSSVPVGSRGLQGYAKALERLDEITGISRRVAEIILAEIGINMDRFLSDSHLASWAGMCPGSKVSAGKRLSGKTTKGSPWLRAALVEAAHGAARSKNTYLGEHYRRLARRIGKKKALVAVAHSILVIIYHILKKEQTYYELGSTYFEERERDAVKRRALRSLERLGYDVSLQEKGAVA